MPVFVSDVGALLCGLCDLAPEYRSALHIFLMQAEPTARMHASVCVGGGASTNGDGCGLPEPASDVGAFLLPWLFTIATDKLFTPF